MKKLVAPIALVSVLLSTNVLASDVADGFNWPDGFSSVSSEVQQQRQTHTSPGFDYPEGGSYEDEAASGFNWPEGS